MSPRSNGAEVAIRPCTLGRGLFALRPYRPGETILYFAGQRVDADDPLHALAEGANLLQTGRRTYILPEPPGLFANHSCDPNAGIVHNRQLVAIKAIAAGEEIRFDYSTTMDEDGWTMACACGESACRGLVTDFRTLPHEVRRRYLELGVVPGFIARRYGEH
jgi:hypothetical protein